MKKHQTSSPFTRVKRDTTIFDLTKAERPTSSLSDHRSHGALMKSDWDVRKTNTKMQKGILPSIQRYDLTLQESDILVSVKLSDLKKDIELSEESGLDKMILSPDDVLIWCGNLLHKSPVMRGIYNYIENAGWSVALGVLQNNGYHLDTKTKTIVLDNFAMDIYALAGSPFFKNSLLLNMMAASRDAWHEERLDPVERLYGPKDILMLERVRTADCDVLSMMGAWEIRGDGYPDIWRHFIGSPLGDMALAFTNYLEKDPSSLFSGLALKYAFREWFAEEERSNACDHQTLEYLDDILLYAKKKNPFGTKHLMMTDIEALSRLPNGTIYLDDYGFAIQTETLFAGLHDPINHAHLSQITYDLQVTVAGNVPFQDQKLARMIFPKD